MKQATFEITVPTMIELRHMEHDRICVCGQPKVVNVLLSDDETLRYECAGPCLEGRLCA